MLECLPENNGNQLEYISLYAFSFMGEKGQTIHT